jgi:hypothetical protein
MTRWMRVLGVLLPFLAAASCGGGYTAGDACATVGTAECNRYDQCYLLGVSVSSCKSMFQNACCGNQCGATADSKEEEDLVRQLVNDCASAFKTFSCDLLYEGYIPAECDFLGYAAPVVRQSVLPAKPLDPAAAQKALLRQSAAAKARKIMSQIFKISLPE